MASASAWGADAISLWLVALTTLLTPLAIGASWQSIRQRQKEYYAWMLVLLFAMLGVFLARDVLLFYVFFELTLVPMFFIIGIWGGPRAALRGRQVLPVHLRRLGFSRWLASSIWGCHATTTQPSFDMTDVIRHAQNDLSAAQRYWVLLALLAGFAVKVPLFPVHTWLPLAHTEAPHRRLR